MPPAIIASHDHAPRQVDGVHAGQADLVDRGRRHAERDARVIRSLASGDLAGACLEDLAHDHVVDLVAGDACAFERAGDGFATELRAAHAGEPARESADRCACARGENGCSHASGLSVMVPMTSSRTPSSRSFALSAIKGLRSKSASTASGDGSGAGAGSGVAAGGEIEVTGTLG